MAVPSPSDIIAVAQRGELLEAIYNNRWGCAFEEQKAYGRQLSELHNDGHVDLLGLIAPAKLEPFQNWKGWHGKQIYAHVLGNLSVSAQNLIGAVGDIYDEQTDSHTIGVILDTWCRFSFERPQQLFDYVTQPGAQPERYGALQVALHWGMAVDVASFFTQIRHILTSGNQAQKEQVIRALHGTDVGEVGWVEVFNLFDELWSIEKEDGIQGALLNTALSWFDLIPHTHADGLTALVDRLSQVTLPQVARAAAYMLAFGSADAVAAIGALLWSRLQEAELKPEAVNLLDLALVRLLREGHAQQARAYVEHLILEQQSALSHFQMLVGHLSRESREDLNIWIVEWLRAGIYRLGRELIDAIFLEDIVPGTLFIDFASFDLEEWEYCFIAKKAIATFFYKPVLLGCILASLARSLPQTCSEEFLALFRIVLVNYPSLAKECFQSFADNPTEPRASFWEKVIVDFDRYLEQLNRSALIAELLPSERESQLERQRYSDIMQTSMEQAREGSFLFEFGAEQVLLYGNGMVSWTPTEVEPFRSAHELTTFSHRLTLPREDIIDPVGLQIMLVNFRQEARLK
ncbi:MULTISPECIES: hypothetical protein [Pseudomonas]|uniref:hypothetical protein n=1 Tax=Pseudomonas TaxID=286 RepID=UPI001E3233EE|nr:MULTISPECIES: hypothetical protein [Pseudomonas]UFH29245.1 hypothetical protein LMH93_11800 [Pseudomonas sp. CIP-10]WPX88264.1 hypothetical protein PsasTeo6_19912 [Pseudomonas asiatica]